MNTRIKIITGALVGAFIIAGGTATVFWKQPAQEMAEVEQDNQITALETPTTPGEFSYGRMDRCCFQGWVFDNNKPVDIKITLTNLDHPGVSRTFTQNSEGSQTEILFQSREDVNNFILNKGIAEVTTKTGFQSYFTFQLYPGRYNMTATYNGKPFDLSALSNPAFTAQWFGLYERRYNPSGPEYIEHRDPFDIIYNPGTDKNYPIKPRTDLISTQNARWSPDGKNIAYTYTTGQEGYAGQIVNVLTPQEVYSGKYINPGRALMGGNKTELTWLDNDRIVAIELNNQTKDATGRVVFKNAGIQTYNHTKDTFEYPMKGYIENVYSAYISPEGKKFLFEVTVEGKQSYIVTDINGKEIKRLNSFSEDWYNR